MRIYNDFLDKPFAAKRRRQKDNGSAIVMPKRCLLFFAFAALSATFSPPTALADTLDKAVDVTAAANKESKQSQKKIDKLFSEERTLFQEYRTVLKRTETLEQYTAQLKDIRSSQQKEIVELEKQLISTENLEVDLYPLLARMLKSLEEFIVLDIPFLPEERQQRISRLQEALKRSDFSLAEKYRQILEAYQIETEYGRTIETYRARIEKSGSSKIVDFLRIGRTALYYQSLDGEETARFNADSRSWEPLPARFASSVKKGIRVARKSIAPELLVLPVEVPKRSGQ